MTIRVVIADDQMLVRAGFSKLLDAEADISVVGQAGDGVEAVAQARRLRPQVMLMDIRMPNLNGLEATRLITRETETQVLILTTYDLDEYVFDALRAGASGFLLKDSPPDSLIAGIFTVARGDALLAPTVTRRLIAEFVARPPAVSPPQVRELSPRETEVLIHLAHGESNREMAARMFVGETTVKTHVSSILAKLGCRDRVQAVVLAYEAGLVRPGMP